ncbi:MAG: ABC transporter ATP-binding protein [Saccharospirillum sp.]|nr:ABC transporter ATP-binding protein [Saccharospirillum sp.]
MLTEWDKLPNESAITAELPFPFGSRFKQFSLISNYDNEIRTNIAASQYEGASDLVNFLSRVYSDHKLSDLKVTKVGKFNFYFVLLDNDYYIREDHLSSGEYFLIQLYRLITSGASLILIDELDLALDAAAQVKLYNTIKEIVREGSTKVILFSHSLAFMSTVDEGGLYYLENGTDSASLEARSFGYVKSDLYGFIGKDRYIITEDDVLVGFLNFLIRKYISPFFEYEIIPVGGLPQIETMGRKNDVHQIFGDPSKLIIFVDKDIVGQLKYSGPSKVLHSPVDDIELFIWQNKDKLPAHLRDLRFKHAEKEKATAKTFWKKILRSDGVSRDDLFAIVACENEIETDELIGELKAHLCLD